ncbi:MAG: MnhB domain-containing protein [Bdellovibrionia bacterium]
MNPSLILKAATKFLFPIIIIVSLFIFWRGHNLPGGGFIGGLIAGCGFVLYALAFGVTEARKRAYVQPTTYMGWGLVCAVGSGFFGWFLGQTDFMAGIWGEVPLIGKIGTPVLFDLGVYLLVLGFAMHLLFSLLEESAS